MDVDEKLLRDTIDLLSEQIRDLINQRLALQNILDGPRVTVVGWRYGSLDDDDFDTIPEAARFLSAQLEYGESFPESISVGGAVVWRDGNDLAIWDIAQNKEAWWAE